MPQVKYFLYYPIVIAAAALLLWIYPTDAMTAISSSIGTVIACLMMWEYLFTSKAIRLTNVCAMGLLIGYSAGTLNSWLTLPRAEYPLATAIGQTVPELANAVAATLMGCALLLCVGELAERPVLTIADRLPITSGVKRVAFVGFIVVAAGFAAGEFSQGGVRGAGPDRAGFVSVFIEFMLGPTVVLATVAFLTERKKIDKYLFGGIVLFLWILEVTQGRRDLVYPALVTIPLARYAGFRWGQLSWKRILFVVLVCAFLLVGVLGYQLLRLAGYATSSRSIGAETRQSLRWVQEGRAWTIATNSSARNLQRRTLVIVFLSDLLYRAKTEAPAHGEDLLMQLETTIPSILDKNKPKITEEQLASETFAVQYPDLANSLFTAGALDFALWGVIIYPIATILLLSYCFRLGSTYFSYEVALFGLAALLQTAIAAEQNLDGYFGAVRNWVIFALFLYLVSKLPRFEWRSDYR